MGKDHREQGQAARGWGLWEQEGSALGPAWPALPPRSSLLTERAPKLNFGD